MTTPEPTQAAVAGNTDAPIAVVKPFGPTEAVSLLVTIGGLLAALFGRDWGISSHAESIVSLGYIVGPAVLGFSRAIKHHSVSHANAAVYLGQLQAVSTALHSQDLVAPADVAAGMAVLNSVATPNDPPVQNEDPATGPTD